VSLAWPINKGPGLELLLGSRGAWQAQGVAGQGFLGCAAMWCRCILAAISWLFVMRGWFAGILRDPCRAGR
jgi:hypothetical protein